MCPFPLKDERRQMWRGVGLLLACMGLLTVGGCMRVAADSMRAAAFPDKGDPGRAAQRVMMHGGIERSYLIQAIPGDGLHPVVILLHGGTQSAKEAWRETSLPTLGAQRGFIVVAPNGIDGHWNDGRGAVLGGEASMADDVGFLQAVIAQVIARDHGDPRAVFMVGASNGGFMTQYFACRSAGALHAAASALSNLPADFVRTCKPSKPLPWMTINGTEDPLIPFSGQADGIVKNGRTQPALLSADQSFRFWADHAGCAATQASGRFGGPDGQWVERRIRSGCQGGTSSLQYVMHGAGHVLPGLPLRSLLVRRIVGEPCMVIDAGTVVWDFFAATLAV